MDGLPDGMVTFLFTDVEGSTRAWEDFPDLMMLALDQHDFAIDAAVESNEGFSVKPRGEGDSRFVVFTAATDAVTAVAEMQAALAAIEWATPRPILVRMALHTGAADLQLGDYYGPTVNRAARLRAIAHGGQTVMSASTYELVRDLLPSGVTVRDMGEHGLKDLTRPEHVYQVDVEGLPDTFPPLVSLGAVPNNLPVQLTEFVGRQIELEDAKRNLKETRLLTILAPGGTGKTRLAIQAGADLTGDFPQGVFFVDLAPISSPDDIIQAVAESLGIALSTDEKLQAQLLAYLANKSQLLIFDNFEHLSSGAAIVAEILTGAPHVKVIATSRSKLNIVGETIMALSGLDTEWPTPEDALRASGVQLFVHAAQRADASFTLSEEDLGSLGDILGLVEGSPLGIELAAAWVDVLPVSEIAAEIARTLDFLESEVVGMPDRHRSMRAVFDYTWNMLGPDERQMFSALSVFRGGFTREAADAVAGASTRGLANLASKSLVVADRESGRFTIHQLLRQYAEVALQEDRERASATMAAHSNYYAVRAARAEQLISLSDQNRAIAIVEDDLDNMRSAWRYCLSTRDGATVRKFIFALWFLHEIRGWHQTAVTLFGEALNALDAESQDEPTDIARSSAAAVQAWFLALLGQPEAGAEQAGVAVARLAVLSDPVAHIWGIQCQCGGLTYLSRWEELLAKSNEAVRVAEELGSEGMSAELKVWAAMGELQLGNIDTGVQIAAEADEVLSRREDYRARSWNLIGMAIVASMQGRSDDAIELLRGLLSTSKEIGYLRATQMGLQYLGEALVATDQFEEADAVFLESLAMSEEMGQIIETAGMLTRIARVRSAMGKEEESVAILASVLNEPVSTQTLMVESTPVSEMAAELLTQLEIALDPEAFATAHDLGAARNTEDTARELLST